LNEAAKKFFHDAFFRDRYLQKAESNDDISTVQECDAMLSVAIK